MSVDVEAALRVGAIAQAIRRRRFHFASEDDLQEGLSAALEEFEPDGYSVRREVRLNARDRVDLLVDDDIVVEVKVMGSPSAVARQCRRYLELDEVAGLILVTTRARHRLPEVINGKPVAVVSLIGAGL